MSASNLDIAVITGVGAALVTAVTTALVAYGQRTAAIRNEHRLRAFERHLTHYERIFSTARSVQDSMGDYVAIQGRATSGDDPMLRQLLEIMAFSANAYNTAVDWQHNSGMLYLDIKLEEHCLNVRNLLTIWLAKQRVTSGNVVSIASDSKIRYLSTSEAKKLTAGDYRELRVQETFIVAAAPGDQKLASQIDKSLSQVIAELKAVLAY